MLRERIEALLLAHDQQSKFLPEEPNDGALDLGALEGPGTQIDSYKLLEKLGEGGFGAVWAAEQRTPVRRRVALKIIKLGMDTKQVVARFEAERQALALMDHPNIAKVLDAGATDNGRPYFVMELVKGISLIKYCDQEELDTVTRLKLFIQVCHAIQHAHQKGIIHRDIKPSNIMVTLHDGVPVPRVIDFGIAKATHQALTDKTIYTQYSQFIGTPAYMSPEQAEMSGLDIDTRCDVYSLGVLLYELLTGRTPFNSKELLESGLEEMRRIIREREPQRPSTKVQTLEDADRITTAKHRSTDPPKLFGSLRGDLDWIVMKCLEKDRKRRYETATGLAADVVRYLDDDPVEASPPSTAYRMRKLCKRHKGSLLVAVSLVTVLIAGLAASLWQAKKATQIAEARRQVLYCKDVGQAHQSWLDGNLDRAQTLLRSQRPGAGQTDLRGFEWRYLSKLCQDQSQRTFGHIIGDAPRRLNSASRLSCSKDGRYLAITEGKQIRIWNYETLEEQLPRLDPQTNDITALAFSPAREGVIAFADGNTIKQFELGTDAPPVILCQPDEVSVNQLAYSPDGEKLALICGGRELRLWDIRTRKQDWSTPKFDQKGWIDHVTFSPKGTFVVAAGVREVRIWDVATGLQDGPTLDGHTTRVISTSFSPDGNLLATCSADGQVILWDMETREARPPLIGHYGTVLSVAFSPDGKTLFSGGDDSCIRSWSVETMRQTNMLRGHAGRVYSLVFSPLDQSLISAGETKVKVWDVLQPYEQDVFARENSAVLSALALSPNGTMLATATSELTLWDVPSRNFVDLPGPSNGQLSTAFSPNGRFLASGGYGQGDGGVFRMWDLSSREMVLRQKCNGAIISVVFSPDGTVVSAAGRFLKSWRVSSGNELKLIEGDVTGTKLLAYSPTSPLLATARQDGRVSIWSLKTGREVTSFENESTKNVTSMTFSNDGKFIAISRKASINLFTVKGETIRSFHGHKVNVHTLAFTDDSKTLVSASADGTVKFWQVATGQQALSVMHRGPVSDVAFSQDGTLMATPLGATGKAKLWHAPPLSEVDME